MRIEFLQQVALSGYHITEGGHLRTIAPLQGWRPCDIMAEVSLFQKFANIESEADIVAFANAYGPLGVVNLTFRTYESENNQSQTIDFTGPYHDEVRLVRNPLPLRNLPQEIADIKVAGRPGTRHYRPLMDLPEPVACWKAEAERMRTAWEICEMKGIPDEAQREDPASAEGLMEIINMAFANELVKISPTLHLVRLRDADTGRGGIVAFAENLLSALWFQIAQVIAGERFIRQCANSKCLDFFEIGGEHGKHAHARYCSNTCRAQANNSKLPTTREGRRLRKEGKVTSP